MTQALYELDRVSKRYGRENPVLQEVSLSVSEGGTVAIVGPSGSGKSTLLNLMGGLDVPTGGTLSFAGLDVSSMDDRARAGFRRDKVGFVFQRHHLLPQLTALENVLMPALARRAGRDAAALDRGLQLLERAGLGPRAGAMPGELSGGERQRVAVVRALINNPRLLLADEPTGSLDATTAAGIVDLLLELNRRDGVAIVVVTHANELARRMNRVLELRNGRLSPVA